VERMVRQQRYHSVALMERISYCNSRVRCVEYGELSPAYVALIESSPPSAIPVVSPASEEHEKHAGQLSPPLFS
jgi:hypothetical protein